MKGTESEANFIEEYLTFSNLFIHLFHKHLSRPYYVLSIIFILSVQNELSISLILKECSS